MGTLASYCAFTRTCPSYNGNSLPSLKLQVDVFENIWAIWVVSDSNVSELNTAGPWPTSRNHLVADEATWVLERGLRRSSIFPLLGLEGNELLDALELLTVSFSW